MLFRMSIRSAASRMRTERGTWSIGYPSAANSSAR